MKMMGIASAATPGPLLHHTIHICKTDKNPKKSQWQKNMVKNNIAMEVI